ncbi:MAG: hypothetical protein ACF8TS_00970, partial [Maioricimonas sp. JB049]
NMAFEAKRVGAPGHVKDLFEIQWEATHGTLYVKPPHSQPKLAVYIAEGGGHLLLDVPRGECRCLPLSDLYDVESIRTACFTSNQKLKLPREVIELLTRWQQQNRPPARTAESRTAEYGVLCLWQDPYYDLENRLIEGTVARPVSGEFPFELPTGFMPTSPD